MKNICFLIISYFFLLFIFGGFINASRIKNKRFKTNEKTNQLSIDGCYVKKIRCTNFQISENKKIYYNTDTLVSNLNNIENSLNKINENLLILNADK